MKNRTSRALVPVFFATFLLAVTCVSGWAQNGKKEVEIDGLIIDQTRTKVGHDFHEQFSLLWENAPVKDINMVVDEYVDPRLGVWIIVEVNTFQVYRSHLKPGYEDIEASAREAIESTRAYIASMRGEIDGDTP